MHQKGYTHKTMLTRISFLFLLRESNTIEQLKTYIFKSDTCTTIELEMVNTCSFESGEKKVLKPGSNEVLTNFEEKHTQKSCVCFFFFAGEGF